MATRTLLAQGEEQLGSPQPAQQGLNAWSLDPAATGGNVVLGNGYLHLIKVVASADATIAKLYAHIVTTGASLTSGQNLAGLYSVTGTKLGETADQTTAWGTIGLKAMTVTVPVAVTRGTHYLVGLLVNHGGTSPAFLRGAAATAVNAGQAAAPFRWQYEVTGGRTALPASSSSGDWASYDNALWAAIGA